MRGWLRVRAARRDTADDLRVLHALDVLKVGAREAVVAELAGLNLVRTLSALHRLVAAGQVAKVWDQPKPRADGWPRDLVYRVAEQAAVER